MKKIIMSARNIKKYYDQNLVLDIKEFNLYQGRYNILLGPNGCGKTTLLKILSLVDTEYQGELYYKGRLINQDSSLLKLRRKMAVIWQKPYLYKGSIFYNIALPLKLRNIPRTQIAEKVNELAYKLSIDHLLAKKNGQISGGELQKVSIARAIITKPDILFVDEPTNNLDEESRDYFNSLFAEFVSQEMTILVVTHDRDLISHQSDCLNIMKEGKFASV